MGAGSEATQKMSLSVLSLAATILGAQTPLCSDRISGSHQGEASRVYQAQTDQHLAV